MPKEKFNPIAELPTLPGANIAADEAVTDIIDATYPPIDKPNKEARKPEIEIRPKGTEVEEPVVEKKKSLLWTITKTIVLICFIFFILLGIFFTLQFVPKLAGTISNFSKPFTSMFTSKKTDQIPTSISLVATSTPRMTNTVATTTIATKTKTPAKLVSNIISSNAFGHRVVVRFNIQNTGGTTSGSWSFSVTLPSHTTPTYYSEVQSPLAPQSGVIYTLGFDADLDLPVKISIFTN